MITKEAENIYRIKVPLPGNPLKYLNSYVIHGYESDLLIDTGFRRPECKEALEEGLTELGYDKNRLDVIATHFHADHTGLVKDFAGDNRKIYLGKRDLKMMKDFLGDVYAEDRRQRFLEEGFPPDLLKLTERPDKDEKTSYAITSLDDRFVGLETNAEIRVGDYTLRVIPAKGHTPGNIMLYLEKEQIMFTGDHILFDISPNITAWVMEKDSLRDYLDNLEAAKVYPVKIALPGHREKGDYLKRIEELIEHHARRLQNAIDIVTEEPGLSCYEITGRMRWKIRSQSWEDFPVTQKWFAVGEGMSHLDHLVLNGKLRKVIDEGIWKYYPT